MKKLAHLSLALLTAAGFFAGTSVASAAVTETTYIFDPGTTGSNGTGTGSNGSGNWDNTTADFEVAGVDKAYPPGATGTGTATSGSTTLTLTSVPSGLFVGEFLSSTAFPAGTYITAISGNTLTLSSASTASVGATTTLYFTPSTTEGNGTSAGNGVSVQFGGSTLTGTAGTVTVSGTQYADTMAVNSTGYTFTGGTINVGARNGALAASSNTTSPGGLELADGTTTIINSQLFANTGIDFVAPTGTAVGSSLTLTAPGNTAATEDTLSQQIAGTTAAEAALDTVTLNSGTFLNLNVVSIGNISGSGSGGLVVDANATLTTAQTLTVGESNNGLMTVYGLVTDDGIGTLQRSASNTTASGRLIIESGGTYTEAVSEYLLGFNATGGTSEIDTAGTFNVKASFIELNSIGATTASTNTSTLNVTGGTTTTEAIDFGAGFAATAAASGTGVVNVSGGTLSVTGAGTSTASSATNAALGGINNFGTGTYSSTVNVDGGTLTDASGVNGLSAFNVSSGSATVVGINNVVSTTVSGGSLILGGSVSGTSADSMSLSGGTVVAAANITDNVNTTLTNSGVNGVTIQTANSTLTPFNLTMSGIISGTGGFTKTGTGTLNITGLANTYSGPTLVSAGTLSLASGGTSSVEVASGAGLNLNLSTSMAATSTLTLDDAELSAVGLDYATAGGTDTIDALFIDGIQIAAGTYTAAELDAMIVGGEQVTDFTDPSGLNSLTILTGAAPEPSTWAMLFLGLGSLVLLARRRSASNL